MCTLSQCEITLQKKSSLLSLVYNFVMIYRAILPSRQCLMAAQCNGDQCMQQVMCIMMTARLRPFIYRVENFLSCPEQVSTVLVQTGETGNMFG
jgi:hypothetical protein